MIFPRKAQAANNAPEKPAEQGPIPVRNFG
jgi:hypothetical protein